MRPLPLIIASILLSPALVAQPTPFGMQGHSLLASPERHRRTVDLMVECGIGMMRDEVYWRNVEREPGVMELPEHWLDNVRYAVDHGVEVLLILNYYNPNYDDGMAPHTEVGREAFGRFCEFMVRETQGLIDHFEIWNEPNIDGFWPPTHSVEDYAALLGVASEAVRRANPDAFTLGCSLSGIDHEFLGRVLDLGGYEHMDAVSIHPYCYPRSPEAADIWGEMARARELTAQYGDPLDVWVTEIGYPTNLGGGVTERFQAQMIARTYVRSLTLPWIRTWFWYWFGPDGPDRSYNEDNFGIVRQDWTLKPAYQALRTLTGLLSSAEFAESLAVAEGIEAHVFALPASAEFSHITALWTWEEIRHTELQTDAPATLVTVLGDEIAMHPHGGTLYIDLSEDPVYLLTQGVPVVMEPEVPQARIESDEYIMTRNVTAQVTTVIQEPLASHGTGIALNENFEIGGLNPTASARRTMPRDHWRDVQHVRPLPHIPHGAYPLAVDLFAEDASRSGRLITEIEVVEAAQVAISPLPPGGDRQNRFVCEATNLSPITLSGHVSIEMQGDIEIDPAQFTLNSIEPGETASMEIEIATDLASDAMLFLDARVTLSNGETVDQSDHISFLTCSQVLEAPTIDGDLSDWVPGDSIHLNREGQINHMSATWDGPEDASATVWAAWDRERFFIAVEVQDDLISDPCQGFSVYKNDGLEIYFDADHDGDREENHYSSDDNQYGLFNEQGGAVVYAWSHLNDYSPGGQIAITLDPSAELTITGEHCAYLIEASIPMAELGIKPRDGLQIGFSVALTDDDSPSVIHAFGQDVQMSWTGLRHAWQNPHQFGDLFFVERE